MLPPASEVLLAEAPDDPDLIRRAFGVAVRVPESEIEKQLASVAVDFVLSKMKEPAFAKGALRNRIYLCSEKLGIKLEDFVKINLEAMQSIADQLGL